MISGPVLNAAHLFVFAPLFIAVGLYRNSTPDSLFTLLGFMAVGIFFYHAYAAYKKISEGKSAWVNWIHIFLIVPLLAILARYKKDASRRYFEMLMMLGFAAAGYHGFYLIKDSIFA